MSPIKKLLAFSGYIACLLVSQSLVSSLGFCQEKDPRIEQLIQQTIHIGQQLDQAQWDPVIDLFDATMRTALPKEALVKTWDGISQQMGSLERLSNPRHTRADQYDVVLLKCEFAHGPLDLKIVFDERNHVAGLFLLAASNYQPPPYAKADDVLSREVTVGRGLLNLPGTLMYPRGASAQARVPAVVLVHGSGPQDRDETIGPNKVFLDLAYGLATRGIAVLRYEKRTRHYSALMALQSGMLTAKEETIDDAVAAVELLRAQDEIRGDRIYVLGHSLGGMFIPRMAERSKTAAGFIGLAASARPLEDLILQQSEEILRNEGPLTEEQTLGLEKLRGQVAFVKSSELQSTTSATELPLGIPASYWLDLRGYNPAEAAKNIQRPVLMLQGERDYQVTAEDWELWQAALHGRANCTLRQYPVLNHLFMEGTGRSRPAEYLREAHVHEMVITDIAQWIMNQ